MPSKPWRIELTEQAETVYRRMAEEAQACLDAGDGPNSKVTAFNMVDELIDKIIPHDPFAPERSLSGPLSGLFRVKKGRLRVCYAGSSQSRRIVILYISETLRKDGAITDPYVLFTRIVRSGQYDAILDILGLRRPNRTED